MFIVITFMPAEIDYGFYVMFAGMVVIVAIILYQNVLKSKQKRTVKSVQDVNINTVSQSYQSTIEILKDQIELITEESKSVKRRLAKEIGLNYERDGTTPEKEIKISSKNLEEYYKIDISAALPLISSMKKSIPFLKDMDNSKIPELINNPIVKKYVWDYIKKNKDEMISLHVIVPIGQVTQVQESKEPKTEEEQITNNESSMMGLAFDNTNGKYMA